MLNQVMPELFSRSKLMILDFRETNNLPSSENIETYFLESVENGVDPKLPQNRQAFNESMLDATGARYLVSRYAEDRIEMLRGSPIANEGRTLHMGIDIFSRNQEDVLAPCNGEVVIVDNEPEDHSFGHYLVFRPDDRSVPYIFFGHLDSSSQKMGKFKAGETIGRLGSYEDHENGGWSTHLHLQMIAELPGAGDHPLGYSSVDDFPAFSRLYPDPMPYFPSWKITK